MSVASGVDVRRMAFHSRLPMRPGLVTYSVRLTSPVDRIVFSSIVALLPRTLSVGLEDRRLTVHVLDLKAPALQEIQFIEELIAGMHGSITRKDPLGVTSNGRRLLLPRHAGIDNNGRRLGPD